ncbi:5'-methylthioadenosine/S-adenosylhomocysteine nucleosidase [Proteiniphilum sp.]|nr:5'-methylthioadenosine/S-adenosylhomocysteine nucleosidase [Proteiniphilum sp.]MEA4917271.1 5'-methylthioadenosine/S-adenosylhomocysteine nucleosidase [Proteiniphilum sp.]
MTDTEEYLPQSRTLFRKFMQAHYRDYFEDMREARVGPSSGYWYFYRDGEVIQHIRDIVHNLEETFGNVTIPGEFTSPKLLVEAWKWFHDYLQTKETELFDDVFKTLEKKKQLVPEPLRWVYRDHKNVLGLLEKILSMEEVKKYLNEKKESKQNANSNSFDIVIITALHDTEFEALKKMPIILNRFPVADDSTNYWNGKIGNKSILLATDDKMGIAAAASLSTKIISKFSPSYLIMAGIAAGVKDKEKNYGDILVARFTWNYESGKYKYNIKTKTTTFEPNPEQIELDDSIVHIINEIKTDKTLLQTIHHGFTVTNNDLKPDANLKVFMGPFASGSAVLADKKKIDSIRRNNRKLIGIDMETFGVFYAAKSFSNNGKTKAISIKSISDFADQKKSDKFRNYAAYTSASFIYNLIRLKLQ